MAGTSYWWYRSKQGGYGEYMSYFFKGVKYLIFVREPSEILVESMGLTYVGKGDINYIKERKN